MHAIIFRNTIKLQNCRTWKKPKVSDEKVFKFINCLYKYFFTNEKSLLLEKNPVYFS